MFALQQHLPFTVWKQYYLINVALNAILLLLQQHLPFTVLKLFYFLCSHFLFSVATALTVYGIET